MTTNPAPAPININVRARTRATPVQPVASPQPEPALTNGQAAIQAGLAADTPAEPVEMVRGDGQAPKIAAVRAHMIEYLEANKRKNAAAAVEKAAAKRVADAYDVLRAEGFTGNIDAEFLGKTYLSGEHQVAAPNYVDVAALKALVYPEIFDKMVEISQQSVKDLCGELMLQKVLKTGDKPAPKFGVKEKKA